MNTLELKKYLKKLNKEELVEVIISLHQGTSGSHDMEAMIYELYRNEMIKEEFIKALKKCFKKKVNHQQVMELLNDLEPYDQELKVEIEIEAIKYYIESLSKYGSNKKQIEHCNLFIEDVSLYFKNEETRSVYKRMKPKIKKCYQKVKKMKLHELEEVLVRILEP